MDILAIAADTFTIPTSTTQNLGFSNLLLNRLNSAGTLYISASLSPVDSIAPPAVRPNLYRTVPRTCPQKKRRTRKRSQTGDSDDGQDNRLYGDSDDGSFGGSSGGGGGGGSGGSGSGKGWNYDGGADWDESSSSASFSDPAFDFVYQVICWIVLSNCLHFAFKKIFRCVANGFSDPSREKVPLRLASLY